MRFTVTLILLGSLIPLETIASNSLYTFKSEFSTISLERSGSKEIPGCVVPVAPYEISKFEVTNTEYAVFLNAVARNGDPYNLYSRLQEDHFWGGITKVKDGNKSIYRVKAGYEKLPVTFVSWYDAVRYANWLDYGRPDTGGSGIGSTEGSQTVGAYDTSKSTMNVAGRVRNQNANYFIPTCGEWIFAGFFDPLTQKLNRYIGGNSPPFSAPPKKENRTANYYSRQWALAFPHLAPVDAYQNNMSAYGTFNQAGNVMEWVETKQGTNQMALGGSLFLPQDTLDIDYRDSELPSKKLSSFGFRIARKTGLRSSELQIFQTQVASIQTITKESHLQAAVRGLGEWQRIGNVGNLSDYRTGRGCVPYVYEIAKTEITNSQYADFLNAVAKNDDPGHLYVEDMTAGVVGGVLRVKNGADYIYTAKNGFENKPVTYLSWFSLARYANWMHFGRPKGDQALGVTEGNSSNGAYNTTEFELFQSKNRIIKADPKSFIRNSNAKYFIPNDDEWYKAAYYDPERTGLRKYWDYPGRSNTSPANTGDLEVAANFQREGLGEGSPYYVSNVGRFGSHGFFKIYDLGGNVWEWLENWRGLGGGSCWRCDIPTKGLRGGSFNYIEIGLRNSNVDPGSPSDHYFVYGGRLGRRIDSNSTESGWCYPDKARHITATVLNKAIANLSYLTVFFWGFVMLLFALAAWIRFRKTF